MIILWSNRISAFHRVNFQACHWTGFLTRTFTWSGRLAGTRVLHRPAVSAKPICLRDLIESEPVGRETDSFKRTRPACVSPLFSSIAAKPWIHSFGWISSIDYGHPPGAPETIRIWRWSYFPLASPLVGSVKHWAV
jgi:hypothetical protein